MDDTTNQIRPCLFLEGNLGFRRPTHGFENDSAAARLEVLFWVQNAGQRERVCEATSRQKASLSGPRGNIHRVCEAAEARKSQ